MAQPIVRADGVEPIIKARFERVGHRITGDRRLGFSRGAGDMTPFIGPGAMRVGGYAAQQGVAA